MKTLVLGATPNPERYAYRAVRLLRQKGVEVVPVGVRSGSIDDLTIEQGQPPVADVHTVTLYINPERQRDYYDYLLGLNPRRIIFNPGTENPELYDLLQNQAPHIAREEACTLVLLQTGGYFR